MHRSSKRRHVHLVAILVVALSATAVVPSAIGAGVKPQVGKWAGLTLIAGQHGRPNRVTFTVAGGKPRKVKNLEIQAPRCDGALTKYSPNSPANVKNGSFSLKDTINYSDGFATIDFEGTFNSGDNAGGTISVKAKYNGTPCQYTLRLVKAVPLG